MQIVSVSVDAYLASRTGKQIVSGQNTIIVFNVFCATMENRTQIRRKNQRERNMVCDIRSEYCAFDDFDARNTHAYSNKGKGKIKIHSTQMGRSESSINMKRGMNPPRQVLLRTMQFTPFKFISYISIRAASSAPCGTLCGQLF